MPSTGLGLPQKLSPKRKFWAGYPFGHPAKSFGQAVQILEKTNILARTSRIVCAMIIQARHGLSMRTPICHIVPISRIYGGVRGLANRKKGGCKHRLPLSTFADVCLRFRLCFRGSLRLSTCEQRHFLSNKAKTFRRHFCLRHYKTRCTPEKRDRIKNPRRGQHPERDQNEIGTRYKFT